LKARARLLSRGVPVRGRLTLDPKHVITVVRLLRHGRIGVTPPYKISRFHVRRAKLDVASQRQSLTPEALARYRVPRVALVSVTAPAKRTQGVHGPQCASVKGLSPVMRRTVGADML